MLGTYAPLAIKGADWSFRERFLGHVVAKRPSIDSGNTPKETSTIAQELVVLTQEASWTT